MLEWMHDEEVIKNLQTNFSSKNLSDCEQFIIKSVDAQNNLHLAIVDFDDVYMGTVSLKNIKNGTAEFAITVRSTAMGKGYSQYAMDRIIHIGLEKMGLSSIFWCVSPENKRAIRFYDKNGYQQVEMKDKDIEGYSKEQIKYYLWYAVCNCRNDKA